MAQYGFSTNSSSSSTGGTGAAGGFDLAKAIFNQVDVNHDGTIDRSEFQQWASGAAQTGGSFGGSAQYESSGFAAGAGAGAGGSFDASTYSSTGGAADAGASLSFGASSGDAFSGSSNVANASFFEAPAASTTVGLDGTAVSQAAGYTAESNAAWSRYGAEVRGAGLFFDANPQIIRRPAAGGVQTYTQNIKVRFLQPPPVPPPGPLIIREVRPPQPPPPQPLRIRQQAPPLPQQPPLVLRERPPQAPAVQASQTVVRTLPALPVPPRSVIIERIPAAPPRPRDIIIERWIPYGAAAKRKTIVQRAAAAKEYPKPRNIIIQYEPVQVRVVRQFQRLGVVQENPQAYLQRYGAQLLDTHILVQQARAAGVVEDISPPAGAAASASSASFSQGVSFGGAADAGGISLSAGEFGGASSSFSASSGLESSEFASGSGNLAGVGFESGLVDGGAAVSFGSSSIGLGGGLNVSSGSAEGFSSGTGGGAAGFDIIAAAFNSADKNKDGTVDAEEFKQFYQGGL